MNASIYVIVCVIIFIVVFMVDETFNFLFEKKYNNITDYNNPNFIGPKKYIKVYHFNILFQ